jgi:rhombotail lipoprotein
VGIAFVPEDNERNAYQSSGPLSESQRVTLINEVSASFKKLPFVKAIEVIPSAYLRPKGSFANLDQLQSMFDVDVVALLSYDQVQFTDEGLLSLTYWTLIGAYVVQGEKNDTQTMLDAAVYDIKSRKLLLRAPGTSRVKHSATPINLSEELRRDREQGFEIAATNLVANFHQELAMFHERVKKTPEEIKIVRPAGYKGGGSLGIMEIMLVAVLGVAWLGHARIRQN